MQQSKGFQSMVRRSGSFLLVVLLSQALWAEESTPPTLRDLALPGVNGKLVPVLGDESDSVSVVCFLGSECPLARLYGPRLNALSEKWKSQGVFLSRTGRKKWTCF